MAGRAVLLRRLAAAPALRRSVLRANTPACRMYSDEAEAAPSKTYSPKIENIVSEVSSMTILEVADLVAALKDRLNIADMPMAVAAAPAGGAAPAAEEPKEEQTEFDIKLVKFDDKAKIKVIKEVRNILPDLKLAEAKKLVEDAPQPLKKGISKEEAEKIKAVIEAAGGTVEIA